MPGQGSDLGIEEETRLMVQGDSGQKFKAGVQGSVQGQEFGVIAQDKGSGLALRSGLRQAFRSGALGRGSGQGPRQVSARRSRQGFRPSFIAGTQNESSGQGLRIGAQTRVSDQVLRSEPRRSGHGHGIRIWAQSWGFRTGAGQVFRSEFQVRGSE